jgi:copper chaperone CopZ
MKKLIAIGLVLSLPVLADYQSGSGQTTSSGTSGATSGSGTSGTSGARSDVPDSDRMSTGANPNTAAPGTTGTSNSRGIGTQANPSQKQSLSLKVTDMTCAGCETRVQNAVRKVPGVRAVTADAQTGQVSFTMDGRNKVDETAVIRAIEAEGFKVVR